MSMEEFSANMRILERVALYAAIYVFLLQVA